MTKQRTSGIQQELEQLALIWSLIVLIWVMQVRARTLTLTMKPVPRETLHSKQLQLTELGTLTYTLLFEVAIPS